MNQRIQHKIDEYKKMASSHRGHVTAARSTSNRQDSLATVIRSKKDADEFMAELESAVKRSR
jgi:hypothetical protein